MDCSDRIVSMLYIKADILASRTYYFITGKSVSKDIGHIKERLADFGSFKEEVGMNKIICNKIQTIISLQKEDLATVIENNENSCSSETKSYYWLSFDGLKKLSQRTLMTIYNQKNKNREKQIFLIDKSNAYVNMVDCIQ